MPSDIFSFLKLDEGFAEYIFSAVSDFLGGVYNAPELAGAVEFFSSVYTSFPIAVALSLALLSILILLFPTYAPKPLAVLYSAFLGFSVTVAYFPREAAENLPVLVIAAIVGAVALVLNRLVSLLSYFAVVGILAYASAYLGYFLGFGEGDVFVSLLLTAVIILASLLLITPIRTLGVALFGGLLFSAALSVLINLPLIFKEASNIAVLILSVPLALLSIYRLARKRSKCDNRRAVTEDTEE